MATPGPSFLAVATNPAIDRVARLDGPPSGVVRAAEMLETPGGKAIHTACVAAELGARSAVITTAGGPSGELLLALLTAEPIGVHALAVEGATRGTYTLVGPDGGDLTEIHEPGGELTPPECDGLAAALAELPGEPAVIAVCGSLPPGAPADLHARLLTIARERGAFTILDSSSPAAIVAGLGAGPDLAAPNLAEACAVLGLDPDSAAGVDAPAVAARLRERGAGAVWLSLGARGSVFADGAGCVRLTAPAPERAVNAVGCGDALIGGFAAALVAGRQPREAIALGAAAATDKVAHLHPGRVDRAAVEALEPRVELTPVADRAGVR
jgi:1-phosphofructokinase family hexose kinase